MQRFAKPYRSKGLRWFDSSTFHQIESGPDGKAHAWKA